MDILPSQNAGIKGVFFDAMTLMKKMVAASVHPTKVKNLRFWSYLLKPLQNKNGQKIWGTREKSSLLILKRLYENYDLHKVWRFIFLL